MLQHQQWNGVKKNSKDWKRESDREKVKKANNKLIYEVHMSERVSIPWTFLNRIDRL